MISIILPVYNAEKYLQQCINSIVNQSYKDFELIIVNDGSTDKSKQIIESFKDHRIQLINLEKNLGKFSAGPINVGLKQCTGAYITWVSADDYYLSNNALEILYNALIKHNTSFVSAPYQQVGNNPHIVTFPEGILSKEQVNSTNCIGACFLFKKSNYTLIGPMQEDLVGVDDWEYWIRMCLYDLSMYKINCDPLIAWRSHGENTTTKLEGECLRNLQKLRNAYAHSRSNTNI